MKSMTLMAAAFVAGGIFSFGSVQAMPIKEDITAKLAYPGDFAKTCKDVYVEVTEDGNSKMSASCLKCDNETHVDSILGISHKQWGDTIQNCDGKLTFTKECDTCKAE